MAEDRAPCWAHRVRTVGLPLLLLALLGVGVALPADLPLPARLSLLAFGAATVLWTTTSLDTAYVAFGAMLFLVVARAIPQAALYGSLSSDVVWLLIGAFIVSAAFEETGLADRLTALITRGDTTVGGMCWRLTFGLLPLAFVIPSTSGRAAVMLPVFRSLSEAADDRKIVRALALLIPSVILVSTIASLVGAGSHLIANELLAKVGGRPVGFGAWALYGLPFAVAASALTCWVIGRMFLDADLRRRPLALEAQTREPMSGAEWRTVVVTVAMIGLWVTQGLHPFDIALVALAGAFVLATPGVGVIGWKAGVKAVKWKLILFVGAALALGHALIDTGAAKWLIHALIGAKGLASTPSPLVVLLGVLAVSLTSHIYFTSHTARTAALLPPLLLLGGDMGARPAALMFIATVGMDYCLTFPVASKALLMFEEIGQDTFEPPDLLKLSLVMLPAHAVLMLLFYFAYWKPLGLTL